MNYFFFVYFADLIVRPRILTPHNRKVAASLVACLSRDQQNISKNFSSCEELSALRLRTPYMSKRLFTVQGSVPCNSPRSSCHQQLQKGGVPATPSGTATLLRLSPSYQFRPRSLLAVTNFRRPRLPWLDGRCVQGPGTYSPRHG